MKYMGIDYGDKRIGLAISDEIGIIAMPIPTLTATSLADAVAKVQQIARSHKIEKIVVGLPLHRDGTETQQSIKVRYFAEAIRSANGFSVEFWNESFSTQEAQKSSHGTSKRKKQNLDSEAARIILQEYLDATRRPHGIPAPELEDPASTDTSL